MSAGAFRSLALALLLGLAAPMATAQQDPASAYLRDTFPAFHDALWDTLSADTATRQAVVAAWSMALEMSSDSAGGGAIARAFDVDVAEVVLGLIDDPAAAAGIARDHFALGLAEDAAVAATAGFLADSILAAPPFEGLGPESRAMLRAAIQAVFEEGYFVHKGLRDPTEILAGLVDRAADVWEIAQATRGVVESQREALVAVAQALETAAYLAQHVRTDHASDTAMATVLGAQESVSGLFGRDDEAAVQEIVNLAFIALLAQQRGDTDRALSFANQLLAIGEEADTIGPFSAIIRFQDWITAIAREEFRDAPAEAAFVMVSSTSLRFLFAPGGAPVAEPEPVADVPAMPEPPVAAPGEWGPGIVVAGGLGYSPCREQRDTPDCLADLGLTDQAIAFSQVMDGDYSGMSVGSAFQELGPVDLGEAEVTGASTWYVPVLLNGEAGFHRVEMDIDPPATFRDDTSRAMLARFPAASPYAAVVNAHRILPDGTQRFVVGQTMTDQCRACDIVGVAYSFIEIGPATGNTIVRRPIGLFLDGPGQPDTLTAAMLAAEPVRLQARLNALGYEAGPMDGLPGRTTRNAMMQFQVEHCLVPTGEADAESLAALADADGFSAPCAGATLPAGITPNAPLIAGLYVDDPALCAAQPDQVAFESRLTLTADGGMMFGGEDPCTAERSDMRGAVTLFRGTCMIGNAVDDGRWTFDLLTQDSFLYLGQDGTAPPRRFTRCADDSPLGAEGAAAPQASAPLPQGRFASNPDLCLLMPDPEMAHYGDVAYSSIISFSEGTVAWGEVGCRIHDVIPSGDTRDIRMTCSSEGMSYPEQLLLENVTATGFTRDGERFEICGDGEIPVIASGIYVTDLSQCAAAAAGDSATDFRVVEGEVFAHGPFADECSAGGAVLSDGSIAYAGHCPFSEDGFIATWRWQPTGPGSFVEVEGLFPSSPDAPWGRSFLRCPSLDSLQEERAVAAAQAEANDPCRTADWTGVVRNVVDLFACDTTRAMTSLSAGREIMLTVGDLSLRDGWIYVTMNQRSSYAENMAQDMSDGTMSGWDQWLAVTGAEIVAVTCAFDVSAGSALPQDGTVIVTGRLLEYASGRVFMECNSPRRQ